MSEPVSWIEAVGVTMAMICILSGGLGLLALIADGMARLPRRRWPRRRPAARPLPGTPGERAAREVH